MDYYIHIPKSGGTSIKYAKESNPNMPVHIQTAGHNQTIHSFNQNVCFIVRDPWERFCSGFWERKTMPQRRNISKTNTFTSFGYADYNHLETNILNQCATPDDYVSLIRKTGFQNVGVLTELCASIQHWIGNPEEYKKQEHKVVKVFDIKNMDNIFKNHYNTELPQDAFRKRSRKLFDIEQSYECSPSNTVWFTEEFRKADYKLIEYITQQNYYAKD